MSHSSAMNEILLDHLRRIDPHAWPGVDSLTLGEVLKSYAQVAVAGQVPGKSELLANIPNWRQSWKYFSPRPDLRRNVLQIPSFLHCTLSTLTDRIEATTKRAHSPDTRQG